MVEPSAPEVSVVVRTFNEERRLPALLEGLASQVFRNFETIVVDSGSFDRTVDIARRHADQIVQIRSEDFTFGYSLNQGIRRSRGRFVVLVSAHTEPMSSRWLDALVAPLRDDHVAMVYGQQRGKADVSHFGELRDFVRVFGDEPIVLHPPRFFANNANAAIQRRLWDELPFDETLPGLEDIAWAKRWMECGYRVVYAPTAGIYHIHEESWQEVRRRYFREGQAARWIGLHARRNLARDVIREIRWLGGDLWMAAKGGHIVGNGYEIVRFRYEKLLGTLEGVWNGAIMENPMTREQALFGKSHNAVVIHGVGKASLAAVDTPKPRPSEVLVRVAYVGVCATDLEILDGELGYYKKGQASYPIVPGHEFSGTVAAVGPRVENVTVGDRVVVECIQGCGECPACKRDNTIGCVNRREVGVIGCDGGYQQYMVTPSRFVHVLPEEVPLLPACVCEPAAVVLKGLKRLARASSATGPQDVAVVGAGPIGHLAARILQMRGHRATVFDRSPKRRALFDDSGITTADELADLSPFQSIIEATGDPGALEAILQESSPGATLLLLGLPYAHRSFSFETIVGYDKVVVGSVGSSAADFEEAISLIAKIDTSAFTERILPISDFEQAWKEARARAYLKVVLEVDAVASPRA